MNAQAIEVTPEQACEALRLYRQHVNTPGSVDWEIERIYRQIAKGKKVIQAIASVVAAGPDDRGRPKLALIRANAEACYFRNGYRVGRTSSTPMFSEDTGWMIRKGVIELPGWTHKFDGTARALVPYIPPHIRPKADLGNYHILWEAEWSDVVPVDPMLLRRIGKGDTWVVLAAWDLTPVERAVLSGRRNANPS